MIEFSKVPYQFFDPKPLMPLIALERPLNRFLLRFQHKIVSRSVIGHGKQVKRLIKDGAKILFTPNHPTRTDPQFMGEVGRTVGIHTSFMAAYDIFLENKLQCWFMQRSASFSIDREGNDRKAMSTALNILKEGKFGLTIFPEGNVFHLNDKLTPTLDGPAFIAAKAHQMLKGDGEVYVVPVSLKYTHLTDVTPLLQGKLNDIASKSNFSDLDKIDNPVEAYFKLGAHVLSNSTAEHTNLRVDPSFTNQSPEQAEQILTQFTSDIVAELETELSMDISPNLGLIERIRKVRSNIQQFRDPAKRPAGFDVKRFDRLYSKSIFAYRLYYYITPYLREKPTLDRYSEAVNRLHEDFFSISCKPMAKRKAYANIGEPISLKQLFETHGGKTKAVLPTLSEQITQGIQTGVDEINKRNTNRGSQLII